MIRTLIFSFLLILFTLLEAMSVNGQSFPVNNAGFAESAHPPENADSLLKVYRTLSNSDSAGSVNFQKLGFLYFSQQNYRKSQQVFDEILRQNPTDELALKYHFWSALNTGSVTDARKTLRKMNAYQLTEVDEQKPGIFQQVDAGSGVIISNNFQRNGDALNRNRDTVYSSQVLDGNMYYSYLGVQLNPLPWLGFYVSYQNLHIKKWKQHYIQDYVIKDSILEYSANGTDYYRPLFSPSPVWIHKKYDLVQNQYYVNAEISPGKGWKFVPAFHYLKFRHEPFNIDYSTKEFLAVPYDTANTVIPVYRIYNFQETFTEWAGGLNIYKDLGNFNLSAGLIFSEIGNEQNRQLGGQVVWFPFGNLNLFFSANADILAGERDTSAVFGAGAGGKILGKLWGDISCISGNLKSFTDNNVYIVYNTLNRSDKKISSGLTWVLNKNINLQLRYIYSDMQAEQMVYPINSETHQKMPFNSFNAYQTHSIIAGISWKL